MRNPSTIENQTTVNYTEKQANTLKRTIPYGVYTANQSSCSTLRGVPIKTLEQKAQRKAKKTTESQRYSEFLALS